MQIHTYAWASVYYCDSSYSLISRARLHDHVNLNFFVFCEVFLKMWKFCQFRRKTTILLRWSCNSSVGGWQLWQSLNVLCHLFYHYDQAGTGTIIHAIILTVIHNQSGVSNKLIHENVSRHTRNSATPRLWNNCIEVIIYSKGCQIPLHGGQELCERVNGIRGCGLQWQILILHKL